MGKIRWSEPRVVEISVGMTESWSGQVKTGGKGDDFAPENLTKWFSCDCCTGPPPNAI
jgi:hypothetical protein